MDEDLKVLDWLLEESTKAYDNEVAFTASFRDRTSFLLGLLITPIGGAIVSLFITFKGDIFDTYNLIFFTTPLAFAAFFMFFSLWKILNFLRRTESYKAPLTPGQLLDFYKKGEDKATSFLQTKQAMLQTLREAVENNIPINERRLKDLISCQKMAVFSVPFIVLCSLKYFHTSYTQEPEVFNVRLVNDLSQLKGDSHVQSVQLIRRSTCQGPKPPKSEIRSRGIATPRP